jgi:hypothetical protein
MSLTSLMLRARPGRAVRLDWVDALGNAETATVRPVAGPPH